MSFDVDECIERLLRRELLAEPALRCICSLVKPILLAEPNVKHIMSPVTIVGDVHGQFYDLLEIFRIGGPCPNTNYLFLGDYVDRGHYSVETISLLVCLKVRYPDRITLLRGNHETRKTSANYGFYRECQKKYPETRVWELFNDVFDFLTLSVVVDNQIFCVHGGLAPSFLTLDQIHTIDRFREMPMNGPMADMMWSDPDLNGNMETFTSSPRGIGYVFGTKVVKRFLAVNGLDHIIRAHQLCVKGYQISCENLVTTVWSAPNYCYRCGNDASILELETSSDTSNFNIFCAAPNSEREKASQAAPEYFL